MLKIIVLIKPISDLSNISISRSQERIFEKGPRVANPSDLNALEVALKIKDYVPAEIIILTLASSREELHLRKALAMGADAAYLAADPAFENGDALSNTYVLGLAIKKVGPFDLILCGHQSERGIPGQTGPRLAGLLGVPHVLAATQVSIKDQKLTIEQEWDDSRSIELSLPAIIAVKEGANSPRIPPAIKIIKASKEKVPIWDANELGADVGLCGQSGSATQMRRSFLPDV
jgi:electron transfer flavoprotein beta subunit